MTTSLPEMRWMNEPPAWQQHDNSLVVTCGPRTDFWRKTHYGFVRDNGHHYAAAIHGDFHAQVRVYGAYTTLYDQAGLMLRLNEDHWIKCGIEYVHGVQQASVVVTHEFSDWSVVPLPDNPEAITIRMERRGDGIEIAYSRDGVHFDMLRLAYFPTANPVYVGLMLAAPEGEGFNVRFDDLVIAPVY